MRAYIQYGSTRIDFQLMRSSRKTLGITVKPDLNVLVKAPVNTPIEKVKERLKKKASWIIKQQNYFQAFHPKTPPRKYVSGETHLYLGRQYRLKIRNSLKPEVKLKEGYINVFVNSHSGKEQVKKVLNDWYKERAEIIFRKIYDDVGKEFSKRKILSDIFIIRDMKKRWGSCTPGKKIIVNTELIKAPKGCIEYVIVHEMCHLKYPNHSKAFYSLQSSFMPNWEFWKNKLEKIMS
ncbi:hypothetical protein BMS3Abin03_00330 [bacterium BMS3Abin03]|nr:hypothetical protein BMS3Abin03_00330 [bacterium BMS3Abin03]